MKDDNQAEFAFNDPHNTSSKSLSGMSNGGFKEKVISGGYIQKVDEGLQPRILIICLGRREAGLDLHIPYIANSLDLTAISSRETI